MAELESTKSGARAGTHVAIHRNLQRGRGDDGGGGNRLKRNRLLALAVVVVAVVIVGAVAVWVLVLSPPQRSVSLRVVSASESGSDAYGRTPGSGNWFLTVETEVNSSLAAPVVLDNSSFTLWVNGTPYGGRVGPPGRLSLAAGGSAQASVIFELPFSSLTQRIRVAVGGAASETPFAHQMSGPPAIGVSRADTGSDWVLSVVAVPSPHLLTTTTFLMRWPGNSTVVTPPGQATLESLKTVSGGVQYLPVTGSAQTGLYVSDVITISKSLSYFSGMQITIADGAAILWTGTL